MNPICTILHDKVKHNLTETLVIAKRKHLVKKRDFKNGSSSATEESEITLTTVGETTVVVGVGLDWHV